MQRSNAIGLNNIPIEVWRGFGEYCIRWFNKLFNVILRTHKMTKNEGSAHSSHGIKQR